jgi:hypothetical protein
MWSMRCSALSVDDVVAMKKSRGMSAAFLLRTSVFTIVILAQAGIPWLQLSVFATVGR